VLHRRCAVCRRRAPRATRGLWVRLQGTVAREDNGEKHYTWQWVRRGQTDLGVPAVAVDGVEEVVRHFVVVHDRPDVERYDLHRALEALGAADHADVHALAATLVVPNSQHRTWLYTRLLRPGHHGREFTGKRRGAPP